MKFWSLIIGAAWIGLSFGTLSNGSENSSGVENLTWGSPVAGLQLSLSLVDSSKTTDPEFHFSLRNVGPADMTLNLGSMLANGKVQLPDNLKLNFMEGNVIVRRCRFLDSQHSFVAGRVDDYIVPLRAGSTYTLRIALSQFSCKVTQPSTTTRATNQLTAEFDGGGANAVNLDMQGIKSLNFWRGTVVSNPVTMSQ